MLASQLKVINLHSGSMGPGVLYVGRPNRDFPDARYGNIYTIEAEGSRAKAIERHWYYIHNHPELIEQIRRELAGKNLACYCAPQACHANTLLRIANATPAVLEFRGAYDFLSNFYPATVRGKSGIIYPTAEHAFQASKSKSRADRQRIAALSTPGEAKAAGRALSLRSDWEAIKIQVMRRIVRAKFKQHPELVRALIDTRGAKLIEGNWWHDTFWGACRGKGLNHLGRILMALREEFLRDYGFA